MIGACHSDTGGFFMGTDGLKQGFSDGMIYKNK
jgi:hypothetical protein